MVPHILISVPLRSVPKGGLFAFNRKFYKRCDYLRSNSVFCCIRLSDGKFILFSSSEHVNYYKGFSNSYVSR